MRWMPSQIGSLLLKQSENFAPKGQGYEKNLESRMNTTFLTNVSIPRRSGRTGLTNVIHDVTY